MNVKVNAKMSVKMSVNVKVSEGECECEDECEDECVCMRSGILIRLLFVPVKQGFQFIISHSFFSH